MSTIHRLESSKGVAGTGAAIKKAAKAIRCEEAVLAAILEVESGGDAYDARGRLIILPEKHIFWRYLPESRRIAARAAGLATPKWSRSNYKGLGGKGSDARWTRMRKMAEFDERAALKSASYGSAQIMGFNHKLCGFADVVPFVIAMAEAEDNQDDAFVQFLLGSGLAEDLRERDFRAIARRYNGPGQVDRYAGMMSRAYQRIAGKTTRVKSAVRQVALRLGSAGYKVRALQEKLCSLGYHTAIDGDFGPATRRAVVAFQADHGLKADGIVGAKTDAALEAAVPIMVQGDDGRQNASLGELKKRSQTARKADHLRNGAVLTGTGAIVVEAINTLDGLNGKIGWLETVTDQAGRLKGLIDPALALIGDHPWIAILIAAGITWYFANGILKRRLHDFRTWRHVG